MMKRGLKYEFNSILIFIILLMIMIFVMLITKNHPVKYDLTKNRINTLSEQTASMMKNIKEPLKAVAFVNGGDDKSARALFDLYREKSPHFTYEFINPLLSPAKTTEYDVNQDKVFFVEMGKKRERINLLTEENLTNAIVRVTSSSKRKVFFLSGHGEASSDSESGSLKRSVSSLRTTLDKEIYETAELNLALKGKIPSDASLVIIAEPEKPILPVEKSEIKKYFDSGGKIMWFVGNDSASASAEFLGQYNIGISKGFVDDEMSKLLGAGPFMTVAALNSGNEVTAGLGKSICLFPLSRALTFPNTSSGIVYTPLVFSSAKSKLAEPGPKGEPEKIEDSKGAYVLALSAEKNKGKNPSRLIVFGSANSIYNSTISEGANRNLVLNAVAWLTGENNLISIRPKDHELTVINLTDGNMIRLFFYLVVFPPTLFAALWLSIRIVGRMRGLRK